MAVFKKRNRIVSFRVSDEEFEILRRISEMQGAHSLSDYARWVTLQAGLDGQHPTDGALAHQLKNLDGRIEELSREVARLNQVVGP